MPNNDFLKQTLDHYRQQLQKKREELRPLELMIRQMEKELGDVQSQPDQGDSGLSFTDYLLLPEFSPTPQGGRPAEIRPDEFFGMSQSEATKAYLKKVGRAVSLDEIVTALNKGGAKVGGAYPKKTLYVSLMRNPMREFVSPSENHIGLRSFYPGLPKSEKAKTTKGKKRNKKKAKSARPASAKANSINQGKTELQAAVSSIFGDGEELTASEVVERVEKKLARAVTPISIYGMLRTKGKFETVNGKFKKV